MDEAGTLLPIIQADRDAAADYADSITRTNLEKFAVEAIQMGRSDDAAIVQAFARHRIAATTSVDDGGGEPPATPADEGEEGLERIAREMLARQVEGEPASYKDEQRTAYHIRDYAGAKVWAGTAIRAILAALRPDEARVRLLSFDAAKRAGEAMFDRWKAMAETEPPLTREDAAWADLFRAGNDVLPQPAVEGE